jgi:Flp pilus assembly protein TadB
MGSDDDIQKSKRIIAESTAKIEKTKSVASKENQDPSESLESKKNIQELQHKNSKNIQELQHKNSKHELAVGIYKKLFWSICVYIILVLLLLAFNEHCFQLRDWVLITLLSTTTANILGVFYIASKWLYETAK